MKAFDEYPFFYILDNRKNRKIFPITKEVLEKKYEAILPKNLINWKNILDLWSCLWARWQHSIFYWANTYTWVEIQSWYYKTSKKILSHFSDKIKLYNLSIDNFLLEKHNKKYDIILLLWVIYCFVDYFSLLKNICNIWSEYIIIESMYIDWLWKENFSKSFIEILNNQNINLSDKNIEENKTLLWYWSRLSPKALIDIMYFLWYSFDSLILPEKIINSYDPYNSKSFNNKDRYILKFKKWFFSKALDLSMNLNLLW